MYMKPNNAGKNHMTASAAGSNIKSKVERKRADKRC